MSQNDEGDVSGGNDAPRSGDASVPDRAEPSPGRLASLLDLWPAALIGLAGLATLAWIATLAWFGVHVALRLLGVA